MILTLVGLVMAGARVAPGSVATLLAQSRASGLGTEAKIVVASLRRDPTPRPLCMWGNGNFCAFSEPDYQGDILLFFTCDVHYSMPWYGYGSGYNNQYGGAQAQFLNYNHQVYFTTWVRAITASATSWTPIFSIDPC